MNLRKGTLILAGIVILAVLLAGCTSSKPATTTPTAPAGAAITTAAPAAQTTPQCPDKYEKGVWDYSWDTRWMSYASNHDIRVIAEGKEGEPDSWNGINSPPSTVVTMTQKCFDVTGTVAFAMDPPCSGTITGTIEKNQLSGTWKAVGCEPEEGSTDGKFSLTMAADNKTWTGKLIGTKWLDWCSDCPPNWAARRV
jgi:hypothetical protein